MRASGIGVWSFVRVVSMVAIAGWGVSMLDTLVLAPKAAAAMRHLEESLANAQASYEVQPRVFYEDFKDYVLYIQDVRSGAGAANWRESFSPTSPIPTPRKSLLPIARPLSMAPVRPSPCVCAMAPKARRPRSA